MPPKPTLNADEVAEIFGCDYKRVCALASQGALPAAKIGRAWVFKSEDIQAYLDAEVARQTEARSEARKAELRSQLARSDVSYVGFGRKRGRPRTPVLMTVEINNVEGKKS